MSDQPTRPDPDPDSSTGLEPGGGVPAGETPPAEGPGSAVRVDPGPGRRTWSPWLVIALIALPVLLIAMLFVVQAVLLA
jgi:hypothetical protein